MTDKDVLSPLPVDGYRPQTRQAVSLVNHFKHVEEEILRTLDSMSRPGAGNDPARFDQRWLAIGRTHLEQAFMAINRSVFRPERLTFSDDEAPDQSGPVT